jgi:hypothetical protein
VTCATIMFKVCSRRASNGIHALKLRHNNIKNLNILQAMNWLTRCTSLDLRNNAIAYLEDLADVPNNNRITDLWLDNNPICSNMGSAYAYVKGVRKYFPELKTLDGMPLPADSFAMGRQNYLCRPEAVTFAEEFLKHYFGFYDSMQRAALKDMYLPTAQLTISLTYDQSKIKDNVLQKIAPYTACSRNVLSLSNYSNVHDKVFYGPDKIVHILSGLPLSVHDFFSLCVDVTTFTVGATGVLICPFL